ncbi:MAG: hypothetical protein M3Q81_01735 [bacterium]|nr:hypothetical protein [bacterium]
MTEIDDQMRSPEQQRAHPLTLEPEVRPKKDGKWPSKAKSLFLGALSVLPSFQSIQGIASFDAREITPRPPVTVDSVDNYEHFRSEHGLSIGAEENGTTDSKPPLVHSERDIDETDQQPVEQDIIVLPENLQALIGGELIPSGSSANIRQEPSTASAILGAITRENSGTITSIVPDGEDVNGSGNTLWYLITVQTDATQPAGPDNETSGWVSATVATAAAPEAVRAPNPNEQVIETEAPPATELPPGGGTPAAPAEPGIEPAPRAPDLVILDGETPVEPPTPEVGGTRVADASLTSLELPVAMLGAELPPATNTENIIQVDGRFFLTTNYDNPEHPRYTWENDQWVDRHPGRIDYQNMLPPGGVDALAARAGGPMMWEQDMLAMSREINGETQYFYPLMGTEEINGSYAESDFENGWTRRTADIRTSDYVEGVSGGRIVISMSSNYPAELISLNSNILNNQIAVDMLVEALSQPGREYIPPGHTINNQILPEDLTDNSSFSHGVQAFSNGSYFNGITRIDNTLFARVSIKEDEEGRDNYTATMLFSALITALDKNVNGMRPPNVIAENGNFYPSILRPIRDEIGAQPFELFQFTSS